MPAEFICNTIGAQAETNRQTPPNAVVSVILTDTNGSFARTVFTAPDEVKREILAVGLAAISTPRQPEHTTAEHHDRVAGSALWCSAMLVQAARGA